MFPHALLLTLSHYKKTSNIFITPPTKLSSIQYTLLFSTFSSSPVTWKSSLAVEGWSQIRLKQFQPKVLWPKKRYFKWPQTVSLYETLWQTSVSCTKNGEKSLYQHLKTKALSLACLFFFFFLVGNWLLSILPKFVVHAWNDFESVRMYSELCIWRMHFNWFIFGWDLVSPRTCRTPSLSPVLSLNVIPNLPKVWRASVTGIFALVLRLSLRTSFTCGFQYSVS